MKVALPVALIAFALGLVAGMFFPRNREGGDSDRAGTPPATADASTKDLADRAAAAEKKSADQDAELAKARGRIKELEAQLPKGDGKVAKKKPKTPEEVAAYVEELRGRIPELVEKKDGKALIKLMHELASLGEQGYMSAIEISGILSQDVESGELKLGISQNEFYMAFGGPMVPVMVWGLGQGENVPAGFRIGAAYGLPWQRDVDAGKIFLEALKTEKNADVARALAENLSGIVKPEMASDLAAAAKANLENPAVLPSIIQSLGNISTDEAVGYLEEFARSDNESLRNEAELALIAVRPPAAGLLITYTAPNSQAETAGIRRGDIIVSYNGQAVKDLASLRDEIGRTGGDALVTVMVNRKGEMIPLTIKGSKIGINGKAVAPK